MKACGPGGTISTPLFTIITAVYNGASTIERAVESVFSQTHRDFEYIVMDGGSSDGTQAKLRELSDKIDFWISEPDTGVYSAWNKAVRQARGQWISFLGADDQLMPDALEKYAATIANHPDAQFISSQVRLIRSKNAYRIIGKPWSWPSFARYMTVAHVGAQHHRSLFDEAGLFDESYRICGDYELLLRLKERLRTAFLDSVTANMESGGISNSNFRLALLEAERAKCDTGGRGRLLCAIEKGEAYLRRSWRSVRELD